MTSCTVLLAEERDPRIRVTISAYAPGEVLLCLGLDRVVLTEHQAHEVEAVLARHRERRRPIPAEACTGCTMDADELLSSMAETYDGRRDQHDYDARTEAEMRTAGANCPGEVP